MSKVHGSDQYLKIGEVDVSSHLKNISLNRSKDNQDITTITMSDRDYEGYLKDASVSFDGDFSNALVDAIEVAYDSDDGVDAVYCPGGNVVGNKEYTFTIVIDDYEVSGEVGGMVQFKANGKQSGGIVVGSVTA